MHIHIIDLNIYTYSLSCIGTRQSKQSCFWLTGSIPGTFLESPKPKSSQASYLPEIHAIHDYYLAVAIYWSSIVGVAVWEVNCLRADFNATDIVYVTDVLTTTVLLQCNALSAMRWGHASAPRCCMNASNSVMLLFYVVVAKRVEEHFNRNKVASPALYIESVWSQFSARAVTCWR